MGWEVTLVLLGPLSPCRNTAEKWVRASSAGGRRAPQPTAEVTAPATPGGQRGTATTPVRTLVTSVAATSLRSKDTLRETVTSFCILIYGIVFCTTCGICEKRCICVNEAVLHRP